VGKSELILRFLRGKRAVYHVGKTAPGSLQLKEFLVDVARVLEEPLLAHEFALARFMKQPSLVALTYHPR
jgi:hypothetical protein